VGRFVAYSCSVSIAWALGCGPPTIEVNPICVSTRVLELDPCWVTHSGALLLQTPEGLVVRQLHEDGTHDELATLEVGETCEWGTAFEHDPTTGRMWLIVPGPYGEDIPGRLVQLDSTGHVEWERELVHEGRASRRGWVYHHEGALFVSMSLAPLVPFDPADPDDWPEPNMLSFERIDLAGELVWARTDYFTPESPDLHFASGGAIGMTSGGLAVLATPPLIDDGPSFPSVISPDDGAVIWAGEEGHEHLHGSTDGQDLLLTWTRAARLDWMNPGDGSTPLRELEPARSLLDVRSPTGEVLGHGEVEWPGWTELSSSSAPLGDQLATIVGTRDGGNDDGGRTGITLHAKDGTLECKGTLELGDVSVGYATNIEGREQVVAFIERRVGEDENGYGVYEPALLLVGPPPEQ
jgi:hypothetical protein